MYFPSNGLYLSPVSYLDMLNNFINSLVFDKFMVSFCIGTVLFNRPFSDQYNCISLNDLLIYFFHNSLQIYCLPFVYECLKLLSLSS